MFIETADEKSLLLEKTGLKFIDANSLVAKNIKLRDGRDARLWTDINTGHGILDPVFWETHDYYNDLYRKEFSADLTRSHDQISSTTTYKNLNYRQFSQFKHLLSPTTKYLEVGCSFGGVISQVAPIIAECVGIEPNRKDAEFVSENYKQVKVINSHLEDADVPNNYFDIASSFEVLEHCQDVEKFLKIISKSLKNDGRIHIEVPNHYDAMLAVYKKDFYKKFYYHKAHIHYFTPKSLNLLMKSCGFAGETTGFQMYPVFNQIHWLLNDTPQSSGDAALNWKNIESENPNLNFEVDHFFLKMANEYAELMEKHLISDCLVYCGQKIENI